MIKNKLISLILVFTIIFSLTGCSSTDDAYIYFELPSLPSTFDPQTAKTDSELLVVKNIFEGLLRKNGNGEIVTGIAESYEQNNLTYTFKLKKDAKWSNGDKITAKDFVFGITRAVIPETKAHYASRLFCIKNAKPINNGELSPENLGIKAVNDHTLTIELEYNDSNFLNNLSTAIAMPCNEKFFKECAGKYGLFKENIICNGSYRLTKWNKESFGIRLYKNEDYNGDFIAKNAAVFITHNPDEDITQKLKDNDIDIGFIDSSRSKEMIDLGFNSINHQNICWVMTLNSDLSKELRLSLIKLIGSNVYKENLLSGYLPATSLFPEILGKDSGNGGMEVYNLEEGKNLYTAEIKKLEDKKFPANVTLHYYDNGIIKPVVTDIVGHWQNNLAAFINIESVSSTDLLLPQLKEQTLPLAIFPVIADSHNPSEYLEKFGTDFNGSSLEEIQKDILASKHIVPLLFQNTTLCYSSNIKEIYSIPEDGYLDFSLIVKIDE